MKASVFAPAGERFLGEGEGAHVWTVRRDAAIHAEAHTGDKGTLGLHFFSYEMIKKTALMAFMHVLRQPMHSEGVWSQR